LLLIIIKNIFGGLDKVSKEKEKERFLSIFIANSNAIEGSTLTVKDTFNYLFNDLAPGGHPKKELFMATNMLEAWNYVEQNHKRFPNERSISYMREWAFRFMSGNPVSYMDNESLDIMKQIIKR